MFDAASTGHKVGDDLYAKEVRELRSSLLAAQYELLDRPTCPVIVLVNGVDGAGKGESVNLLNEWLDPRHVRTRAFGPPTVEERRHPSMWRYWQALPPKGKIGVLFGSWYSDPIDARARAKPTDADLAAELERIRTFEQMLVDDGTVLVKLWFHLSKENQKRRFNELEKTKTTSWRVTSQDWKNAQRYDRLYKVSEVVLRETSTGVAPWLVVDGADANYRALSVGRALLAALRSRLGAANVAARKGKVQVVETDTATPPAVAIVQSLDTSAILVSLPFTERLSREKYDIKVAKSQAKLGRLSRSPQAQHHAIVAVFEGMDAAGKGGAIRRMTQALDARRYVVIPIAAPTDEERAQPYLWRFWRHVPAEGQTAIFDRSWYGRVLVERVEGYASEAAWSRAYREINEFEQQLHDRGVVVVKFWLAITKEEQIKRFKERQATAHKQFKITPDDWRNRKKWDDYIRAASDMIDRTNTSYAPWTILEANDKHLARVRALETLNQRLKKLG